MDKDVFSLRVITFLKGCKTPSIADVDWPPKPVERFGAIVAVL
jgi:hypothetical protein